jgi:hypothetical protein
VVDDDQRERAPETISFSSQQALSELNGAILRSSRLAKYTTMNVKFENKRHFFL